MIALTQDAKLFLKKVLEQNTDESEACLRLCLDNEGKLQLSIDKEKKDDQTVEHEGATLLLADEDIADKCTGLTVDVEKTSEGTRLIINGES
ncbi:MAG: hypothetical protein JSV32_04015 [Dehalococcoidia bacterium]|nr:MAG: hypothetical protein JSV32_04015 [Dehalococcoidia bacterium]